jgi:CDP-diacylglycerol--glycerol-3-phosphate 3-phosphatidyltransferase
MVPIFVTVLLTKLENGEIIAFILFFIASITDFFDGYVARKFNQVSEVGKFLDPLADKLLVAASLIALVSMGRVETWVAAIIILREIFITAFRFYFLVNKYVFSASFIAKGKTFFQMMAVGILIIYNKLPHSELFYKAGKFFLYFAVILTVYSGMEYLFKYSKAVNQERGK